MAGRCRSVPCLSAASWSLRWCCGLCRHWRHGSRPCLIPQSHRNVRLRSVRKTTDNPDARGDSCERQTAVGGQKGKPLLPKESFSNLELWKRGAQRLCLGSDRLLTRHSNGKRLHPISQRRWFESETIGRASFACDLPVCGLERCDKVGTVVPLPFRFA